jgi:hypothetical protein
MYHEKFVAVVKANGKILRERGDSVLIPFGSEYSLLLKNLESRRASVSVEIDGEDVLDGCRLIIEPNSDFELERFLEKMDRGNRFKFIQKTQEIVNHRGDKIEDGLIRVEFDFEKRIENHKVTHYHHHRYHYDYWPYYPWVWHSTHTGSSNTTSTNGPVFHSVTASNDSSSGVACAGLESVTADINADEGLTVQGSISEQHFHHGYIGELEGTPSTIVLKLRGKVGQSKVTKPVTVKTKLRCPTCGRKNNSSHNFCVNCGTGLLTA